MTKLKYGGNNLYKVKVVLEIEGFEKDIEEERIRGILK